MSAAGGADRESVQLESGEYYLCRMFPDASLSVGAGARGNEVETGKGEKKNKNQ